MLLQMWYLSHYYSLMSIITYTCQVLKLSISDSARDLADYQQQAQSLLAARKCQESFITACLSAYVDARDVPPHRYVTSTPVEITIEGYKPFFALMEPQTQSDVFWKDNSTLFNKKCFREEKNNARSLASQALSCYSYGYTNKSSLLLDIQGTLITLIALMPITILIKLCILLTLISLILIILSTSSGVCTFARQW
jgi:hypothetical protein